MNDADFRKVVSEHLLKQVYDQIREEGLLDRWTSVLENEDRTLNLSL